MRRVGRGDRRASGSHRPHVSLIVNGRHGLVRGGPHEAGDGRVGGFVVCAQGRRLPDDKRGGLRSQGQRGHRDPRQVHVCRRPILARVPGVQGQGGRVGRRQGLGQVLPRDLVVARVCAVVLMCVRQAFRHRVGGFVLGYRGEPVPGQR